MHLYIFILCIKKMQWKMYQREMFFFMWFSLSPYLKKIFHAKLVEYHVRDLGFNNFHKITGIHVPVVLVVTLEIGTIRILHILSFNISPYFLDNLLCIFPRAYFNFFAYRWWASMICSACEHDHCHIYLLQYRWPGQGQLQALLAWSVVSSKYPSTWLLCTLWNILLSASLLGLTKNT